MTWPVLVFLYGSLLDPQTLARFAGDPALAARMIRPARLHGWRRVFMKHSRYPTLVRHRARVGSGAVIDLPAAAIRRLQAYEGDQYRFVRVVADTERGPTPAFAWIAGAVTHQDWRT